MNKIELILSQFGKYSHVVEPALSSFKKIFPDCTVTLYTDNKNLDIKNINNLKVVDPVFDKLHPRYGWHCSDLYRAIGLLESSAEISIYSDSDMIFASESCRSILKLTRLSGLLAKSLKKKSIRNN